MIDTYLSLGLTSQGGTSIALGKSGARALGAMVGVVGVDPGIAAARAASLCWRSYSTNSLRDANTFYNM